MSQLATEPPATSDAAPRILLFGHPGSGKSSLLGALLQASDTQPDRLEAESSDPGRRLELLRDAVYGSDRVDLVRTPLVTHRIQVQPLATAGESLPTPYPVVIVDCDGEAANALLKHPDNPLTDLGFRDTALARVITDADVLVLAISAGDVDINKTFDDFVLFLERLHGRKAYAREVGGFPIFLALTQCDKLARPGDTNAIWEKRVAQRVAELTARLVEYLQDETRETWVASPYFTFGSIEVQGFGVAVRRPEFRAGAEPSDEPFGVAELFRECFAAARDHRERLQTSERRLSWTVRGVLSALAVMVVGLLLMLAFQPPSSNTLADRIRDYQIRSEPPPEVRLAAKHINQTERVLKGYRDDSAFELLPDDLHRFVSGRLDEVEAYRKLRATLNDSGPMIPTEARTKAQLDAIHARLSGIAIPEEWARTEAAEQRAKWLDDIRLIDRTVKGWNNWYWLQAGSADSLARTDAFDAKWLTAIEQLTNRADRPTVRDIVPESGDRSEVHLEQPVPGAKAVLGPRDKLVTFGATYWFEQSSLARDQWHAARERLLDLRGLAEALALTPPNASQPIYGALFVPTAPGNAPTERMERLEKALGADFNPARRWALDRFDEPPRGRLRARVDESRDNAERLVRAELRAKLDDPSRAALPEVQRYRELGTAIENDPRFRAWGRLLHLLMRLREPTAPDPVAELTAFLKRDRIEFALSGFELRIPVSYQPRGKPVAPTGPLMVTVGPPGTLPMRFKLGSPTDTGVWTVYQCDPEGNGQVTFRPGDSVRIALPVNIGDGVPSELVWGDGVPSAFRFDWLAAPPEPKLVQKDAEPKPAPGVRLTPHSGSSVPPLPTLLPR